MKKTLNFFFFCLFAISYCSFISPLYHSNEEIYSLIDTLAQGKCKNILQSKTITEDGNILRYYTITSPTSKESKNKAMIFFGEHSRELITSELALFLIQTLCKENSLYSNATIDSILNRNKLVLIPIVNEYGRKKVEEGKYCVRRNKNNVDLNRNWSSHWLPDKPTTPIEEKQYSGSRPFSEWETRALKTLINKINPKIFITTHSGLYALFTPLAYRDTTNDPQINKLISIAKRISDKYCHCTWGSIFSSLSYPVTGGVVDYAYEEMKIKYSFAFEIYGGDDHNDYFANLFESTEPQTIFDIDKATKINFIQLTSKLRIQPIKRTKINDKFCFIEKEKKYDDLYCFQKGNPHTKIQYDKTLINWVNAYFDLFTIIYNLEYN